MSYSVSHLSTKIVEVQIDKKIIYEFRLPLIRALFCRQSFDYTDHVLNRVEPDLAVRYFIEYDGKLRIVDGVTVRTVARFQTQQILLGKLLNFNSFHD
jgi:hypothetical protein